jgi:hypothetical protein
MSLTAVRSIHRVECPCCKMPVQKSSWLFGHIASGGQSHSACEKCFQKNIDAIRIGSSVPCPIPGCSFQATHINNVPYAVFLKTPSPSQQTPSPFDPERGAFLIDRLKYSTPNKHLLDTLKHMMPSADSIPEHNRWTVAEQIAEMGWIEGLNYLREILPIENFVHLWGHALATCVTNGHFNAIQTCFSQETLKSLTPEYIDLALHVAVDGDHEELIRFFILTEKFSPKNFLETFKKVSLDKDRRGIEASMIKTLPRLSQGILGALLIESARMENLIFFKLIFMTDRVLARDFEHALDEMSPGNRTAMMQWISSKDDFVQEVHDLDEERVMRLADSASEKKGPLKRMPDAAPPARSMPESSGPKIRSQACMIQ